ncbi:MAG: ATP-dependent Clp protease ATP-binding subunit [Enterocloster clostridioformis]|nr:ATP-dependent Clp protease ATP-binding subunit [Enterocloster clostridioformis]
MMERYTPQAQEALGLALGVAETLNHGYVGTEHLLIGLLQEGTGVAAKVLEENGVEEDRVIELVSQLIAPNPTVQTADRTAYTPRARRVIENSYREAVRFKAAQIGTEHILIAMLREGDCVASRLLNTIGVNIQKLYIDLLAAMGEDAPAAKDDLQGARAGKRGNATPTLDSYSRNLTQLATAGKLDPVIGREQEIQRVIQILSRRTKNNPCLIGEPGVGKTAVVEGLAQMIASGDVPETIADKRVVTLDLSGMVAGSKYRGEFEERIKKVISEVVESGDVLLFIDEIHTIIGAGGAEGALDASNILKPSLARGEIQLIGATTINEYRKYIEKDSALERRFQPVTVDEPTEEESVAILKGLRSRYEEHHKVEITDNALEAAVKLSSRYINDRFLPDKAIDLIDEAASKVRLQNYTKPDKIKVYEAEIDGLEEAKEEAIKKEAYEKAGEIKKKQEKIREKIAQTMEKWQKDKESKKLIVSDNEIADVVSGWTRIPVRKLAEEESERLRNLEGILHQRVVGQEEAVTAISKAIRRGRVGLKDPKRPIGSFLFLGPTGVGKTELSKALSEAMFGTENALIRVDMSEYMEKHSVSKMIGSPPGYVGYDEGGQLSEKVRRNPYSVILFDEIEKAHPDVFNILLQVLDDGHITDAQGRKIDFKNTIIIMTSNAGAENIISPKRLGFGMVSDAKADYTFMKDRVMDEVKRLFKPEFLNRIDEIIVFHQLTREHIKGIADIMLGTISKRCKEQLGIGLEATDSAKEHLIDKGYDDKYGARPLRRTIQNLVEDRMAEEMLDGSIKAGSLVEVGFDGEKLTFTVKAKTARPKAASKPASKPAAAREGSEDEGKTVRGKSSAGRATGRKKETPAPKV